MILLRSSCLNKVCMSNARYFSYKFLQETDNVFRCLLKKAGNHPNLNRITNPYDFDIEGVRILGTSGQNVNDILL